MIFRTAGTCDGVILVHQRLQVISVDYEVRDKCTNVALLIIRIIQRIELLLREIRNWIRNSTLARRLDTIAT